MMGINIYHIHYPHLFRSPLCGAMHISARQMPNLKKIATFVA